MKKICAVLVCALLLVGTVACSGKFDYSEYLSENRTDTFVAEIEGGKLTADTGTRENPYKVDGTSCEKEQFTVITFTPDTFIPGKKYGYIAVIDWVEHSGDMVMHPFGDSYSADIKDKSDASEIPFKIVDGETVIETTLKSVMTEDMIDAERALTVGREALQEAFDSHTEGKTLKGELYVRIVFNPVTEEGGYYWYVALCAEKTYAVLIDPKTEAIIAKRE